ncbi:MAG: hypothetical protein WC595_04770 [Candidatus Nanoarchaeia archaeon]
MNKKGEGEQFNWLFVLIAGAIILSFFAVFTTKYIDLQDKKLNVGFGRTFGENIHLLQSISFPSRYIDDSQVEKFGIQIRLDYTCLDDTSYFKINNDYEQDIPEIVYAPATLIGDRFDEWTNQWKYPYFAANFIYLSDPKRTFYILYDSRTKKEADALDIPQIFTVIKQDKKIPIDGRSGTKKATIFSFVPFTQKDFQQYEVLFDEHAVLFADTNRKIITFYDGNKQEGTAPYTSDAFLYGALFSPSLETYQCNLKKAHTQLEQVTAIYNKKAVLLSSTAESSCSYNSIQQTLTRFQKNYEKDKTLPETLTTLNEDLGGKECPTVF